MRETSLGPAESVVVLPVGLGIEILIPHDIAKEIVFGLSPIRLLVPKVVMLDDAQLLPINDDYGLRVIQRESFNVFNIDSINAFHCMSPARNIQVHYITTHLYELIKMADSMKEISPYRCGRKNLDWKIGR